MIAFSIMLHLVECDRKAKRCRIPKGETDLDRAILRMVERNHIAITHQSARYWSISRPFVAG